MSDLVEKIKELKEKKNAIILAHNYQIMGVQEIADFTGDSLELARKASQTDADIIVFCGVRFMAETAKILSPDKKVLIPVKNAGCPLADFIKPEDVNELKRKYPDAKVVAYVNTTADVKAVSDVCCTSANAIKVCQNIEAQKIIFIPDKNLGNWVQKNLRDKEIILYDGFCYVHQGFRVEDAELVRKELPGAKIVVHPECPPQVVDKADAVLSTSGMLKYCKENDAKEFVIGTEEGLIRKLKKENPDKKFYSLGNSRVCYDMKLTRLQDVYDALLYERYVVKLPTDIIDRAKRALTEMIKYV